MSAFYLIWFFSPVNPVSLGSQTCPHAYILLGAYASTGSPHCSHWTTTGPVSSHLPAPERDSLDGPHRRKRKRKERATGGSRERVEAH